MSPFLKVGIAIGVNSSVIDVSQSIETVVNVQCDNVILKRIGNTIVVGIIIRGVRISANVTRIIWLPLDPCEELRLEHERTSCPIMIEPKCYILFSLVLLFDENQILHCSLRLGH